MTNQKKLIVGAVVVLGAYYLYDRNKKMNTVSDLKAGADSPLPKPDSVSTDTPVLPVGGGSIRLEENKLPSYRIEVAQGGDKFTNFDGGRKNSVFAQYFR